MFPSMFPASSTPAHPSGMNETPHPGAPKGEGGPPCETPHPVATLERFFNKVCVRG